MMGMKRTLLALSVIVIILSGSLVLFQDHPEKDVDQTGSIPSETRSSRYNREYDNIYIREDDDLLEFVSENGFKGNGTEEDPFVIKDLKIDSSPQSQYVGIYLRKTTSNLILRNLTISGFEEGIKLIEVSNIGIDQCHIESSGIAISMEICEKNIIISNSEIRSCNRGILLQDSPGVNILDTMIVNCEESLEIKSNSHRANIKNVQFLKGSSGVILDDVDDITIEDCSISNFKSIGIEIDHGLNVLVDGCSIDNGDSIGIRTHYSHNITIMDSFLRNNTDCGILSSNTDRLHVYDCHFWHSSISIPSGDFEYKDIRIRNNTINGKKLVFKIKEDLGNWKFPEEIGQVFCYFCNNVNISDNSFSNVLMPLNFINCFNITLKDLDFHNNYNFAIYAYQCENLILDGCRLNDTKGYGIKTDYCRQTKIKDCIISDNYDGLWSYSSYAAFEINNTLFQGDSDLLYSSLPHSLNITNCSFRSNGFHGAYIQISTKLRLENNSFEKSGIYFPYATNFEMIHSNNTVNGKTLFFMKNRDMKNSTLSIIPGQIILHHVKNLTIDSLDLSEGYIPIQTFHTSNISILNTTISKSLTGLSLEYSDAVIIENCSILNCGKGININGCTDFTFKDSSISENIGWTDYSIYSGSIFNEGTGIYNRYATGGCISNCTFENNPIGIYSEGSSMTIRDCFLRNGSTGIEISYPNFNERIFNNTIIAMKDSGVMFKGQGVSIRHNKLYGCSFKILFANKVYQPGLSQTNTVNDLPIMVRYKSDMYDNGTGGKGQYIAVECEKVRIRNITFEGGTNSISVCFCEDVRITNCTFRDDGNSIYLIGNQRYNISNNLFDNNDISILIASWSSSKLLKEIKYNIFLSCFCGIKFESGHAPRYQIKISRNLFYQCDRASIYDGDYESEFCFNDIIGTNGPVFAYSDRTSEIYSNNFFYNNGSRMRWDFGRFQGLDSGTRYYYINFNNPVKYKEGNYWTDSHWMDLDSDGIIDTPHVVDIANDGTEIRDPYPLAEPAPSKHIVLKGKQTNDMINLSWELPEYDFLGEIESVTLLRIKEGEDPETIGSFDPDSRNYSIENNGDGEIYVYVAVPQFTEGTGYWSNPVTTVNDNKTPRVKITSPENGAFFNDDDVEILFTWELYGSDLSFVNFNIKRGDRDWQEVGNSTSWKPDDEFHPHRRWDYGWNTFTVTGTDYLGREFNDTVIFLVDYRGPEIEILEPDNGEILYTQFILANWIIEDDFLEIADTYIRFNEEPWINVTGRNSFTFYNITGGDYELEIRANDSAGNTGGDMIRFRVEQHMTPIHITYPSQGQYVNTREVEIQWETGNPDWVNSSHLSIDGNNWIPVDRGGGHIQYFDSEGAHIISIRATNIAGYEFVDSVNFIIDTIPPRVSYHYPVGNDVSIDTPIFFEFSEEMNRSSVEVFVNQWSSSAVWEEDRAYFLPPRDFYYGTEVYVDVRGRDLAGNELEPFNYEFKITDKGEVKGRVVDQFFNPIKGALITFDNGQEVETASDGTFSMEISRGGHNLLVEKEGYEPKRAYANAVAGDVEDIGDIILISEEGPDNEDSKNRGPMLISILVSLVLLALIIALIFVIIRKFKEVEYFEE